MDINAFAKFYGIQSLPFQNIEKPNRRRQTDNVKTAVYTPPPAHKQFVGGINTVFFYIFFFYTKPNELFFIVIYPYFMLK